jgi:hypothetical protein
MSFYEFNYLHATVEHCLKTPTPDNVVVAFTGHGRTVYFCDLPASVWAAVDISVDDPYDNELLTFPSAALRQEWLDRYLSLAAAAFPLGRAATLER